MPLNPTGLKSGKHLRSGQLGKQNWKKKNLELSKWIELHKTAKKSEDE
jgi:hypothetical protein